MFDPNRYATILMALSPQEYHHLTSLPYDQAITFLETVHKGLVEKQLEAQAEAAAQSAAEASEIAPRTFGITVHGQQGVGKTTILMAIMRGLADAGLLDDGDTFDAFSNPLALIERNRIQNADMAEAVQVKVRGADLEDFQMSLVGEKADAPEAAPDATDPVRGVMFETEVSVDEVAVKGWNAVVSEAAVGFIQNSADYVTARTGEITLRVTAVVEG